MEVVTASSIAKCNHGSKVGAPCWCYDITIFPVIAGNTDEQHRKGGAGSARPDRRPPPFLHNQTTDGRASTLRPTSRGVTSRNEGLRNLTKELGGTGTPTFLGENVDLSGRNNSYWSPDPTLSSMKLSKFTAQKWSLNYSNRQSRWPKKLPCPRWPVLCPTLIP